MSARLAAALLGLAAAAPLAAVGLGPLAKEGVIDGPRQGFYLNVYNPYPATTAFVLYAVGPDDEERQARVEILPGEVDLAPERGRRILVIADGLAVGETYRFRVCAQRRTPLEGISLNARVCSKLTSRRIG